MRIAHGMCRTGRVVVTIAALAALAVPARAVPATGIKATEEDEMAIAIRRPSSRLWKGALATLVVSAPWVVVGFLQGQAWRNGITIVAGFYSALLGYGFWEYFALSRESVRAVRVLDDPETIGAEMRRLMRQPDVTVLVGSDLGYLVRDLPKWNGQTLQKSLRQPVVRLVSQRQSSVAGLPVGVSLTNGERQRVLMDFGETVGVFSGHEALLIEADDGTHAVSGLLATDTRVATFLRGVFVDVNGNDRPLSCPLEVDAFQSTYASVIQEEYLSQAMAVGEKNIPIRGEYASLYVLARLLGGATDVLSVDAVSLKNWDAGGIWHAVHKAFEQAPSAKRILLVPKYELAPGGSIDSSRWASLLSMHGQVANSNVRYLPADLSCFGDWRSGCTGFTVIDSSAGASVGFKSQSPEWNEEGISGYVVRSQSFVQQGRKCFHEMFQNNGAPVPLLTTPQDVAQYHGLAVP